MKSTKTKTTTSLRKGKHITDSDRQIIEKLYRKGYPVAKIADLLGFHRSSIYRELKRGQVTHLTSELVEYVTYSADRGSDEARLRASSHGPALKIADDFSLVSDFNKLIIHYKLSLYAARQVLIRRGVEVRVSLRTLYNYVHRFGFPILPHNLIHKPRKHAKKHLQKRLAHNNVLAQSIEKRPLHINDRSDFGHHEMDTVVGPPGSSHVLLVLTERKTRIEHILLMKDKSQNSVRLDLNRLERYYGADFPVLFKSITCDNGSEFLDAAAICKSCRNKGFRTVLFYAHPYCASERGSNENANRLIRRFLPKGTDFSTLSQRQLDYLAMWMNKYPRKLHDGRSAWQLTKVYSFHFCRITA
ncbi:MAG: IS30 family transposase [Akkermansia sp.]|nr:IS30 family transposase [Akkermansia sp.]